MNTGSKEAGGGCFTPPSEDGGRHRTKRSDRSCAISEGLNPGRVIGRMALWPYGTVIGPDQKPPASGAPADDEQNLGQNQAMRCGWRDLGSRVCTRGTGGRATASTTLGLARARA